MNHLVKRLREGEDGLEYAAAGRGKAMIKNISGWWYLINVGAFHAFPFPTKADAEEALAALKEPNP